MNRRGFIAAVIAGAAFDPERLLWRPGAKLISIPKLLAEYRSGIEIARTVERGYMHYTEVLTLEEFHRRYPNAHYRGSDDFVITGGYVPIG